jgi:glutathione S-transferase
MLMRGRWFCPFVQRVWIALEEGKLAYKYIEVNPYKKEVYRANWVTELAFVLGHQSQGTGAGK